MQLGEPLLCRTIKHLPEAVLDLLQYPEINVNLCIHTGPLWLASYKQRFFIIGALLMRPDTDIDSLGGGYHTLLTSPYV